MASTLVMCISDSREDLPATSALPVSVVDSVLKTRVSTPMLKPPRESILFKRRAFFAEPKEKSWSQAEVSSAETSRCGSDDIETTTSASDCPSRADDYLTVATAEVVPESGVIAGTKEPLTN